MGTKSFLNQILTASRKKSLVSFQECLVQEKKVEKLTKWPVFPELASLKTFIFFSSTMHFCPIKVISRATAAPTAPQPMMRTSKTSSVLEAISKVCSLNQQHFRWENCFVVPTVR